jgi:lipoprotein-anchoring transpeptidase ErfK/SrfK
VTRFVQRYGWRAYALPVLTAITIAALLQSTTAAAGRAQTAGAAPPVAQRHGPATTGPTAPDGSTGHAAATTSPPPPGSSPGSNALVTTIALGDDAIACVHNTRPSLVLVSISRQHAWMCQGAKQVYDSPVTTGETDNGDNTPTGTWTIQSRETDRYLFGAGYRDYVHYWLPFDGDFGFHDATWQSFPFGSSLYQTAGSNGCVHLPMAAVSWLYGWATVDRTVVTIQT